MAISPAGSKTVRPPRSRRIAPLAAVGFGALASLAILTTACGGSTSHSDPQTLLSKAKAALDATPAVHFALASSNASSGGTTITGGAGDIVRPDRLQGSLTVIVNGFKADVKVVAVGNTVVAQLPFSTGYSKIDPSTFGLGNPADLLDPQRGLSSLLAAATGASDSGNLRIAGELVEQVAASVPGSAIPVLPDANPSRSVRLVAAINPSNHQLRQVTLTGPFTSATSDSTFVVTLTKYGEQVQIHLPAGF